MNCSVPSHLSEAPFLAVNINHGLLFIVIPCLQEGTVVLNLLDAASELILKQKGQWEEFSEENQEKEEDTPKFELKKHIYHQSV